MSDRMTAGFHGANTSVNMRKLDAPSQMTKPVNIVPHVGLIAYF